MSNGLFGSGPSKRDEIRNLRSRLEHAAVEIARAAQLNRQLIQYKNILLGANRDLFGMLRSVCEERDQLRAWFELPHLRRLMTDEPTYRGTPTEEVTRMWEETMKAPDAPADAPADTPEPTPEKPTNGTGGAER